MSSSNAPTSSRLPTGRLSAVGIAIATLVAVFVAASVQRQLGSLTFASDDSYIYSGYVKMAFTPGAGLFSYNVGEHSAGTTGLAHYYAQLLVAAPWWAVVRRPPTPHQLELLSWMLAWACFAATALLLARGALRACSTLGVLDRSTQTAAVVVVAALACAHPAHVWGVFSGMENPLAALGVTWLATECCSRARRMIPLAVVAAVLSATRPEWIPLAALMPAAALLGDQRNRRTPRAWATSYLAFFAVLLLLFLPLRLVTGQWQPEAYGARAHLSLRRLLSPDWAGLMTVFARHWTVLLLGSGLAAAWAARRRPAFRSGLAVPATLLLFLILRGMFKLTDFNVHDRYVSYLWPALVAAASPALVMALARGRAGRHAHAARPRLVRAAVAALPVGLALLVTAWGVRYGVGLLCRDGREMLQVVKSPSLWMAANLPAHSIVCMEPAGAIRTFTDFVLVDRTGLTTRHRAAFKRAGHDDPVLDFCAYLSAFDVQYVFDYPDFMPSSCPDLQPLHSWEPAPRWQTGGRIELYRRAQPIP